MSNIDEIKNEIRVRRVKSTCINDVKEPSSRKHKIIYNLLMCFMLLLSMFFGLAIYARKDEEASFLNEKLGLSINFAAFNHVISKNMNKVIDFRIFSNLFNYGSRPVSGVSDYLFLGDDLYSNSSNAVKNIADGVVSYINEDESGYMVIVTNDKGYNTFYYDLVEVSIKTNDRVYKDAVIGVSASDEIKIVFSKDESKLSYEEIKLFYE